MSRIVPIFNYENRGNFVSSEYVEATPAKVGTVDVLTAPYIFSKRISLISTSVSREVREAGLVTPLDTVGNEVSLDKVYMMIPYIGVFEVDMSDYPTAAFIKVPGVPEMLLHKTFTLPIDDAKLIKPARGWSWPVKFTADGGVSASHPQLEDVVFSFRVTGAFRPGMCDIDIRAGEATVTAPIYMSNPIMLGYTVNAKRIPTKLKQYV